MSASFVSDRVKESEEAPSPWYPVSSNPIVSVEHPYKVKNVAKAVQSLGGQARVNELVSSGRAKKQAGLHLRPSNGGPPSILSGNVSTQNLLVQISVPKRTGRKRKRYSSGQHQEPGFWLKKGTVTERHGSISESVTTQQPGSTACLLRSLQDNAEHYDVRVVGQIDRTHRFRALPDFVWSISNNSFMQKFKETIEPLNLDAAKRFQFDLSKRGTELNSDLIPPPVFTHNEIPFNYSYHQNASVKQRVDTSGNVKVINESASRKIKSLRVTYDCNNIPNAPTDEIPPFNELDNTMQSLIQRVESLMEERPIWTRRALSNQMPTEEWMNLGRHVYQYVGYEFVSGPWRDTIVKFGIDPRRDPKHRIYQTMTFQFDSEGRVIKKSTAGFSRRGGVRVKRTISSLMPGKGGPRSHIFDGEKVAEDGKTWQVCDITDPLLQHILSTNNIRKKCHIRWDGWYHNGTWAKAKAIAKTKMASLLGGKIQLSPRDYDQLAQIPDILLTTTSIASLLGTSFASSQVISIASHAKSMASSPERSEIEDESMTLPHSGMDMVQETQENVGISGMNSSSIGTRTSDRADMRSKYDEGQSGRLGDYEQEEESVEDDDDEVEDEDEEEDDDDDEDEDEDSEEGERAEDEEEEEEGMEHEDEDQESDADADEDEEEEEREDHDARYDKFGYD